jgi:hypothetical protein
MGGEAVPRLPAEPAGPPQRRVRLLLAPELVEHDGAMNQRLDIVRVQGQGLVELGEGLVRLARQRVGETEQLVRVGERPARRDHFLQEVNRPVVVLQLEPLASLLD